MSVEELFVVRFTKKSSKFENIMSNSIRIKCLKGESRELLIKLLKQYFLGKTMLGALRVDMKLREVKKKFMNGNKSEYNDVDVDLYNTLMKCAVMKKTLKNKNI